ncbi:PKD domain-containing protein [Flaviaesturariibacter flavus]|uniref:PKD domain-containing protein n=1 Tax=Flaviaesturariibacter flavus TaxID=2502780 RepID=A0A4R1BBV3_9BACT|nr:PKD domain-containing protein [Flaviaesturariibacter flavus]TCJ14473.1 PKD domain-containing protein [Flaviaesturariibacter flavus]
MNNRFLITLLLVLCAGMAQGQLQADFTSDIQQGCSPVVVNFRDLSTGGATAWHWDFGNGATSTLQNPSATFFSNGTYTVKLTVTSNNGANTSTVTKTAYVSVLDQPTVSFTSNTNTGCTPALIQFTDQSSTPAGTTITGWLWDFGDNQTSTLQNPTHAFRQAGSFTVTLTITNSAGCRTLASQPNFINVNPGVTPKFTFTDPGVCRAPATVSFTNTSSGPGTLSYSWDFGNGTGSTATSPNVTYPVNGNYNVVLRVSSSLGCSDTFAAAVPIGLVNTDITLPAHICPKETVRFVNNSNPRPVSSRWTFSTGFTDSLPNTATSFPAPGTYTVKLVNTYSTCIDSSEKTFTINPVAVANFSVSDSARCQPNLTTTFTANSPGATGFTWLFGDGTTGSGQTTSHTYTSLGDFSPSLIVADTSGCTDTLQRVSLIKVRRPDIQFVGLPQGGCVPDTVSFKANVITSGTVTSWLWNFGDGSPTSGADSTSHIYPQQGTYNVTLTITTSEGCTETKTLNEAVKVGTRPFPDFVANPLSGCADPGISFTNLSTGATDYQWSFGDGTTSSEVDPVHVFADTGHFNIRLTAINNGCRAQLERPRYVEIKPSVSRFTYQRSCNNPREIIFRDRSVGATTWVWDFGDGTTYTGQTPPAHLFPRLGTFTVTLRTSRDTCSYSLTKVVNVLDATPSVRMIDSVGCRPFRAAMQPVAPDVRLIRKYEWHFGDGSAPDTTQGSTATHIYTRPGTYDVKLVAYDTSGCRYEMLRPGAIKVNGPKAAFSVENGRGCRGLTATFIDSSSTDGRNGIRSWTWDFGDSTSMAYTAGPFTHRYDSSGDYDVKLVVTDSAGCKDSITRRGVVRTSSLKPDFVGYREHCPRAQISYVNLTKAELPFNSNWLFGNGSTSTQYNGLVTFADTGYYSVALMVEDVLGCRDTLRRDSFVHIVVPTADFTANNFITYCTPYQAQFRNQSTNAVYFNWDFGPGRGTSTQENPYTFYTSPGTYPVKLLVYFYGGCKDSVTKNMVVKDQSEAQLTYDPVNGCTPLIVNLSALAPMNARFTWDFGDGNVIDTTINALAHRYVDYGNFVPRIIMREINGACTISLTGTRTISLLGAHARFTLDTMQFCDRGLITANSDSTSSNDPIVSYDWNFGDGGRYTVPNPTHNYTAPGQYDVTLVVKTQTGCTDTLVKRPVKVVASPQLVINGDSSVCRNSLVPYRGTYGFADTSQVQWSWVFPNGNTSNLQNPPSQRYKDTGTYQLVATGINSSGCRDTAYQTLVVHDLPVVGLPATITKFVGVPAVLNATYSSGITGYAWTPATDLSCADCPQPSATPKYNTLYTVTATDSNGCTNRAQVQVLVLCQGAKVFVPNTFTPNGDGANDIFFVQGSGLARMKSLRIFNRWGEVVFERRDFDVNNPSVGWDGTYKGQKAAPDVYIYQLEVFCENSDVIKFEGNVALIR